MVRLTFNVFFRLSTFCLLFALSNSASYAANDLINKIEEAKRSVVHITATDVSVHRSPRAQAIINPLTGQMVIARNVKAAQIEKTGTGIIINSQGFIVTNFHTIKLAETVIVTLANGKSLPAKIVHMMPENDLALLKIEAPIPLPPVTFADSNNVHIRDEIINIGGSETLYHVISGGRINGLGTDKENNEVELIKITIDVYKGDSGGPVFDRDGRLIGIIMGELKDQERSTIAIAANKIKILFLDYLK